MAKPTQRDRTVSAALAVMQNPNHPSWVGYQRSIAAAAPLIGVQPVDARIYTPADIDHTFDVLVREPNGGLLVLRTLSIPFIAPRSSRWLPAIVYRRCIPNASMPLMEVRWPTALISWKCYDSRPLMLTASSAALARRSASSILVQIRNGDQPQDRQDARPRRAADAARARRRGDRMRTGASSSRCSGARRQRGRSRRVRSRRRCR